MKIDIDQSGRIEYTSHDTIIADSIGNRLWLTKQDKRILLRLYRDTRKPRMFALEVFAAKLGKPIEKECIHFGLIGKKSLAHIHAYAEFKKNSKSQALRLSVDNILKVVSLYTKKD